MKPPAISVALCTWNRAQLLDEAIRALAGQDAPPPHEILIVDNGSTDATRDIVMRAAARHRVIRYLHEPRPGLSYARNAALAAARAPLIAFTDDDVRVDPDWLRQLTNVFDREPGAACVGGPVVPQWPEAVPAWLTARHWAPLGIQDYGRERLRVDASRPVCLIGANLAIRRSALDVVGEFSTGLQCVGSDGGSTSTEDHDIHIRLWKAGMYGIYDPRLQVRAAVIPKRLRKRHHRAWHYRHGRLIARMRLTEVEASRRGRFRDVPVHLLRQAARDAWDVTRQILTGRTVEAFEGETRLWFVAGFVRERWT
jgi:glucosyl-dolichyl phosphate glucuronosyltransferase